MHISGVEKRKRGLTQPKRAVLTLRRSTTTATITHVSQSDLGHSGRGFRHFVDAAVAGVAAAWRAARNRRSVNRLLEWDDRMLSDIGLTQSDVRSALASHFAEDPSQRLRAFSGERKAAVRARAHELYNLEP